MTVLIRDDHRFSSTAVQITKLVVLLDVERCLEKIVKVILNSDVIYSKDLRRTGLPTHVVDFLAKCALAGHELVVPETTQIEFEKEQEKARLARISELEKAATVLRQNKVDVPEFSPADLVQSVGLSDLLGQISGLSYAIHEASLGDYKLALRKACLREPPHPPDSKSDEMRDLVIWQTAMRIANESGGALLVSRDEVHTHHRGDIEAAEHQLLRAKDFDDALEILNLETTAGSLVRKYVLSIWDQVIEASEMLVAGAVIRTIKEVQFVDDEKEVSHISAKLTVGTGTGTTSVYDANLSVRNEQVLSLDLVAEGETLNLKPSSVEESEGDLAAKLAALQEILGS